MKKYKDKGLSDQTVEVIKMCKRNSTKKEKMHVKTKDNVKRHDKMTALICKLKLIKLLNVLTDLLINQCIAVNRDSIKYIYNN